MGYASTCNERQIQHQVIPSLCKKNDNKWDKAKNKTMEINERKENESRDRQNFNKNGNQRGQWVCWLYVGISSLHLVFITALLDWVKTRDESQSTVVSLMRETVFHTNREYLKW